MAFFSRAALIKKMLPAVNNLSELGTPIADMVVRDHLVTKKARGPSQTIAKDCTANVSDVHWLGNIRRAEIDEDPLFVLGGANAQSAITEYRRHPASEKPGRQPEIDKPGARHLRRFAKIPDVHITGDLFCEALWSGPVFFGQDHCHVTLIIAKPGIGSGNHLGRNPGVGFLQSQFEPFSKDLARSRHQLRGDRLSKTRRICPASSALLNSSRTALSFRNFAMAASVRRWV